MSFSTSAMTLVRLYPRWPGSDPPKRSGRTVGMKEKVAVRLVLNGLPVVRSMNRGIATKLSASPVVETASATNSEASRR
jgi:hypothetical protein